MRTSPLKLHKRTILRAYGIRKFSAIKLWEGPSPFDGKKIMVVLGNYATDNANKKIGEEMCQIWVLPVGEWDDKLDRPFPLPREAYEGKKPTVCGSCSHLGKGCYVMWWRLRGLWESARDQKPLVERRGGVRLLDQLMDGQYLRLGAAGDPLAMPFWLAKMMVDSARFHTSYTHAWYNFEIPNLEGWKSISMASVDSEKEYQAAKTLGWRTFRTIKAPKVEGVAELKLLDREIECPSDSHGRTCAQCKLCNGNKRSNKIKDIAIKVHGSNLYRFQVDDFDTHPKFEGVRACLTGN